MESLLFYHYQRTKQRQYKSKKILCTKTGSKSLVIWIGWLVVLSLMLFEAVFQSILGRLPKRGRKRRERIDQGKMSKQPSPAPTASAVGPCPTVIRIVGRPGTGSLPSTTAPPDHPLVIWKVNYSAHKIS